MANKIKGLLFTVSLSAVVVFLFFGKIIQNPNAYYFAGGGDGFKAYYGAIYHLEYDTSAMRMNGMNYPYGEMVFFTGSQPAVVNTVKFISSHIVDISDNIVGIMNLLMIFSLVVAAVFIFLIFFELNVSWWLAAVAAIGICMLSPQIDRFGGHFSLSYLFWIPLMIYLVIRYDKKRTWFYSVLIAVFTFLAGAMHMYFLGFYGFIIGFYWLYRFLYLKKTNTKWGSGVFGFFVQYMLPVAAVQLLIALNDTVSDRTAFPFGFFEYRGHPVAVFFPSGRPYGFIREWLTVFDHISWESYAFVGIAALAGFAVGLVVFFRKLFTLKKFYMVCNVPVLNLLFWASFVALLFSFGIPFVFGLEWLVDYIGPLRQLRALARFSWFFFYMLNIVVFYQLWQKAFVEKRTAFWKSVTILALVFLLFDGFWNIYINSRNLHNRLPVLEDKSNRTAENKWVNKINPGEYQAILPIPYFHVGSENIWVESQNNTQELTMIASLKTGLPTTAVQLSRTSISQTYKNYALVTEPLQPYKVLADLPNQKPFLLLFNRKHFLDENEERLIQNGELIYQNENIELRKLKFEKLQDLWKIHTQNVQDEFKNKKLYQRNGIQVSDSTSYFIYRSFDTNNSEIAFKGEGAFHYVSGNWATILADTLKQVPAGKKYKLSFWMYNYTRDGYLRTNLEIIQKELNSDKTTNYIYTDVHRHIKAFYDNWALIEIQFETKSDAERIKVSLRNNILKNKELIADELIVRENNVDLFDADREFIYKNSRKFNVIP